nr:hypothetical protein B0A51_18421 [Rachicladosporium sp. CCFEE 5018]
MAFSNYKAQVDSSDDDAGVDLSSWAAGTKRKRTPPPRPTSGFQAIDQPAESLAVDVDSEPEARPTAAPVAVMQPAPAAMVVSSAEEESSDDDVEELAARALEARSTSRRLATPTGQEDEGTPYVSKLEKSLLARAAIVVVPNDELAEEDLDDVEDCTDGYDVVSRVLDELQNEDGVMTYRVEFENGGEEEVAFDRLLQLKNGQKALGTFITAPTPEPSPPPEQVLRRRIVKRDQPKMTSSRPRAARIQNGIVSTVDAISEDDVVFEEQQSKRTRRKRQPEQTQFFVTSEIEDDDDMDDQSSEGIAVPKLRRNRKTARGPVRRSGRSSRRVQFDDSDHDVINGEDEDESSQDGFTLRSDLPGHQKRTRDDDRDEYGNKRQRVGMRQSARSTRHVGDMEEPGIDKIYRADSDNEPKPKPKPLSAKEIFKQLPRNDEFRMRHSQQCEVCTNDANFGPLIYCQGCTLSYHKQCLGHRGSREHLVTKIGEGDFVLQCRRCVRVPQKKDHTAPDQSKCQDCSHRGLSCHPFRPRKTPGQEHKEREDNGGVDPSYDVAPDLINNPDNVLFRCVNCWRGFHFEHLPSRSNMMDLDTEADAEQRFREYSRDWKCKDCVNMPAKVSGLIAWKPTDEETYEETLGLSDLKEDDKTYLIKWEGHSYFRAAWMPGAWVWGATAASMRKAFAKRDDAQRPKMRTEEAIPEDYLRADIVLDIKFTSIVDIRTEEIDKARIREVQKALIKYKGLSYEDAVWEAPPTPDDGERWTDFVTAYHDWVFGRYVHPPKVKALGTRLDKVRKQDFTTLEKQEQPEGLTGGKLMAYQLQGLNWLYYKWFTQKNAVLADEMGLGKTIQIIGFLATLVQDWSCYPFLIVVPNSTCPNWRREIERWAPGLRVVAYYGSRESRELAYRYEMYPEGSKDLRCHIVVTSYDAAADDSCRKFFRGVQWQGLIVDEGQRLKSEKTLLYAALSALKSPFKVLMTGTPLQNNQRELFNLLQFLDDSCKAAELEEQFKDLDQNKILGLHDMIRPFFLRRTKAQVLTFLPTMAQIIVPVSMSILQKKIYRTILAKNPDLMRAIFSTEQTGNGNGKIEKGSLNNILMQLRKCLCHPFVYSRGIEEKSEDHVVSHRNLVDASSKLKLLELLLPKLQERGHRVLIFSQFLDMLDMVEDFLDGMQMSYQRLDGSIGSLEKQKRIDEYNAPDSPLFAFLLSTRAGGVGINLASADTVIIMDPDFNPHQDIQALSRAHRIGQTKKVLCFQLVTRASAEEKIMQIGRKKLALDHVLIQEMDADEAADNDLATILRHGANELFNDDGDQDINYDPAGIERLLDRSGTEEAGGDKSAETSFSHARVWANDSGSLQTTAMVEIEEEAPDPGVWANILKERERIAAEEAAAKAEAFGRGRRARRAVDYAGDKIEGVEGLEITPLKKHGRRADKPDDESDTDFQADSANESGDEGNDPADDMRMLELDLDLDGLEARGDANKTVTGAKANKPGKKTTSPSSSKASTSAKTPAKPTPIRKGIKLVAASKSIGSGRKAGGTGLVIKQKSTTPKAAAGKITPTLSKQPAKAGKGIKKTETTSATKVTKAKATPKAKAEKAKRPTAKAKGKTSAATDQALASTTIAETGPVVVRAMLDALKHSNEPEHLVREATKYLKSLKGNLVQLKKQKAAREYAAREEAAAAAAAFGRGNGYDGMNGNGGMNGGGVMGGYRAPPQQVVQGG